MNNKALKRASAEVLQQLIEVLQQIENLQYTETLEILSENTIGKHIRHIIEFFECVCNSLQTGIINYDSRERKLQLETSISFALHTIHGLSDTSASLNSDQPVNLHLSMCADEKPMQLTSSLYREIIYTLEHAIHHMAIIRMAILNERWPVLFPDNFGIAYSTIRYKASSC